MTENSKIFLKRLSVIIGVITVVICLFCLMIIPPAAVIILLGGIAIWLICVFFVLIGDYLFR